MEERGEKGLNVHDALSSSNEKREDVKQNQTPNKMSVGSNIRASAKTCSSSTGKKKCTATLVCVRGKINKQIKRLWVEFWRVSVQIRGKVRTCTYSPNLIFT